jgi:hypothetical protein
MAAVFSRNTSTFEETGCAIVRPRIKKKHSHGARVVGIPKFCMKSSNFCRVDGLPFQLCYV